MYPALATLLAASDKPALTGASPESQAKWHAVSKRSIEQFCNQRFDLDANVTVTIESGGGTTLALPRRLATLATLATEWSSLDATDVALSDDHDALRIRDALLAGGGTWVERALRDGPLSFPAGAVALTGDWGFTAAEMPDSADSPIGVAMLLDMESQALSDAHALSDSVKAQSRLGLAEIVQGPLSARISAPDVLLPVDAQIVLEPYIWQLAPVVA